MAPLLVVLLAMGALAVIVGKSLKNSAESSSVPLADFTDMTTPNNPPISDGSNDPVGLALPLIQNFESFAPKAYPDPPGSGKYSIGYGHQIRPGESYTPSSVIGESEAYDLLRVDVGAAWTCVYQNCKTTLSPAQYAALISFCYNVGCGAFKSSTLLAKVNAGDLDGAAAQFPEWVKAGGVVNDGLVARRQQEQTLFQTGVAA